MENRKMNKLNQAVVNDREESCLTGSSGHG